MRRLITLCAAAALFAFGCGGNGGSDQPADDSKGPGDDVVAGDAAADGTGGEVAPDGEGEAVQDVPGPAGVASEDFTSDICKTWCDNIGHCTGEAAADDCLETCVADATADAEFALKLVCAHSTGVDGEDDYCEVLDKCDGDWEVKAECSDLCVLMEGCDALGNSRMGYEAGDCALTCTSFFEFGDGTDEALECFEAALADCSGPEFFVCIEADELPDVCGDVCNDEFALQCGLNEVWESTDDCQAVCSDFSAGQTLGAASCLGMTEGWPLECAEVVQNCFEIPVELPAGAAEYCKLMNEKCGQQFDPDMGDLTDQICGWQLAGLIAGLPELFRPLDDAATTECLDGLAMCPPGDGGFLFCAIAASEEAEEVCDTIEDVCSPPADFATEMALTCKMTAAFYAAMVPEAEAQFLTCIADETDCDGKLACFPEDEEGGEGGGGGSGGSGGGR